MEVHIRVPKPNLLRREDQVLERLSDVAILNRMNAIGSPPWRL